MPKPIFNSLGSNYTFDFAMLAFTQIFVADNMQLEKLKKNLNERYHGATTLVFKGRDAIELALHAHHIGAGDVVLTQAFTCCAIEEAIVRAGATPTYIDLEKEMLNPSVHTL